MQKIHTFDSEPRQREGEPIETLVTEAILTTASTGHGPDGQSQASVAAENVSGGGSGSVSTMTFLWVTAVAILEALLLIVFAVLWAVG